MRMAIIFLMVYILGGSYVVEKEDTNCQQTIETLKQTIEVKEMSNRILKEMVRKRDSIIYVQDSVIIMLKNNIK